GFGDLDRRVGGGACGREGGQRRRQPRDVWLGRRFHHPDGHCHGARRVDHPDERKRHFPDGCRSVTGGGTYTKSNGDTGTWTATAVDSFVSYEPSTVPGVSGGEAKLRISLSNG